MEVLSTEETIKVAYKVATLTNSGWKLNLHTNLWEKKGMSIQKYCWEESNDVTETELTFEEAWDLEDL